MALGIYRLSVAKVAKTKRRGLHADGGGLYRQIAANGSASWIFRYARSDRTRHVGGYAATREEAMVAFKSA